MIRKWIVQRPAKVQGAVLLFALRGCLAGEADCEAVGDEASLLRLPRMPPPPSPATYVMSPYAGEYPVYPPAPGEMVKPHVGRGYNIINGDPHADGEDPGFCDAVIDTVVTPVTTRELYACDMSEHLMTIEGGSSAQEALARGMNFARSSSVDTTGKLGFKLPVFMGGFTFGAEVGRRRSSAFTASLSFKTMTQETVQHSKRFFEMTRTCTLAEGRLDPFVKPTFVSGFQRAVLRLPTNESEGFERMLDTFIATYGTHYTRVQTAGGLMVKRIETSKENYEILRSITEKTGTTLTSALAVRSSLDVGFSNADFSNQLEKSDCTTCDDKLKEMLSKWTDLKPEFDGSIGDNRERKEQEEERDARDNMETARNAMSKMTQTTYYRGRGAYKEDPGEWFNQLRWGIVPVPSPVNELVLILDLLTAENFPSVPDMEKRRQLLLSRLATLCQRTPGCVENPVEGAENPVEMFPRLHVGAGPVRRIVFSPNGSFVATSTEVLGDDERAAIVYRVDTEKIHLQQYALFSQAEIGKNLTWDDRVIFMSPPSYVFTPSNDNITITMAIHSPERNEFAFLRQPLGPGEHDSVVVPCEEEFFSPDVYLSPDGLRAVRLKFQCLTVDCWISDVCVAGTGKPTKCCEITVNLAKRLESFLGLVDVAWSPDGQRLALLVRTNYSVWRRDGHRIYICDVTFSGICNSREGPQRSAVFESRWMSHLLWFGDKLLVFETDEWSRDVKLQAWHITILSAPSLLHIGTIKQGIVTGWHRIHVYGHRNLHVIVRPDVVVAASPDGRYVAWARQGKTHLEVRDLDTELFDNITSRFEPIFSPIVQFLGEATALAFGPNNTMGIGTGDGQLMLVRL